MAGKNPKGPHFVKYFIPVINALKELDGSGHPNEIKDIVAAELKLTEQELSETIASGQTRFGNNVDWARFYLAKGGYIDSSTRGVWSLTEVGRKSNLTHEQALELYRNVLMGFRSVQTNGSVDDTPKEPLRESDKTNYRTELMEIIRKLPPEGFERLCQRLLRESGFEKVTVTGKSGDGGLDGIGIMQVNPFVSFTVLFQSKRYIGTVSAGQVRDFRGAMMGRTDKGIIITTGTFTSDAKREAEREGVPAIELVDGEKMIDLFEKLELGLKPRTTFDVDYGFFSEFE